MDGKIKLIEEYKYYIKKNNIKLPGDLKEKRKAFIAYFIEKESDISISEKLKELSNNHLFIASKTFDNQYFK